MKKSGLIFFVILFISISGISQNYNQQIKDPETGKLILIGECNRNGLEKSKDFRNYFRIYYKDHKPNYEEIKKIIENIKDKDFSVMVVLGSWCKDSKKWVPPFFRVMDEAGIKDKKIRIVAVDKNKYSYTVDLSELNIEKIPTFIFFDSEGKEVGRIVETPEKSLEKDISKIVKKL